MVTEVSGNRTGGLKTAKTNVARYGESFYSDLGKKGAESYRQRQKLGVAKPRGFAAMDSEKVRAAGALGGSISKRPKYKYVADVLEEPAKEPLITRIKKSILHS